MRMKVKVNVVTNELEKIGIKRSYKGHVYLREIIELLYNENTLYEFNLRECYVKVARKYRVKQSAVKGDINYIVLHDYNRKRILKYLGCENITEISVKRLIEVIIDRLYL